MLNWGDKDAAEVLAAQLKDLLRDRTMTYDQLASVYSIKHRESVNQRLKEMSRDGRPMALGDFLLQMEDFFELTGKNQVRARAGAVGMSTTRGGRAAPAAVASVAAPQAAAPAPDAPLPPVMKYADVSRGVQNILKERGKPISVVELDDIFRRKFSTSVTDVVGMSTEEYLQRKENIFDFNQTAGTVALHSDVVSGPPVADQAVVKDELFVVREFEQLVEAMGPVVYISTLCGKFIQRNGVSVTSVISTRPLDLFKRHPNVFLILGAGNVTLRKYEQLPDVQRLVDKPSSKAQRVVKASEEAQLPVPEQVTEQHVVEEFRRLILADGVDSVYISSLCGRFLQRFKKPVTAFITSKPAEFLRRHPDVFVMTGGGNVGLREVLGPDAVSVPPPPPRVPKALREELQFSAEELQEIALTDEVFFDILSSVSKEGSFESTVQRLKEVCRQIEKASFLALDEVVLGGAAGKGFCSVGAAAEIVLFVRQLPYRNFPQWLPHILDTLLPVLESQLASVGIKAERCRVEKDHLRFSLPATDGGGVKAGVAGGEGSDLFVKVFISPVFRGPEHRLECIKAASIADRPYFFPAFVKERSDLIGRQPSSAKKLILLTAWWASKQNWSSPLNAPSDWLLELTVVHARGQLAEGVGIADSVTRVMEVLASMDRAKVSSWADSGIAGYGSEDIWKPLLGHEPLFMDPLNPYANLADAAHFDARELAAAAEAPGCTLAFRREAAKWLLRAAADSGGGGAEEGEDREGEAREGGGSDEEYEDAEEGPG